MPEETIETTEETVEEKSWTPPASQADLDRIISDRLARERAKYADYDEVKKRAEEFDKLADAQKTETERAIEAARNEAAESVRSELLTERVLDKVETLAAKDFADPDDARLRLASRAAEFLKDGKVDTESIKTALASLLTDKPHLAARDGRPRGTVDQGVRDTSAQVPTDKLADAVIARRGY